MASHMDPTMWHSTNYSPLLDLSTWYVDSAQEQGVWRDSDFFIFTSVMNFAVLIA